MSDPRYTFKKFERRNDIGDIKERCYNTSAQALDDKRRTMTTYRHDYVPYPLGPYERATGPKGGLHIGGGNMAPTAEEMMSDYQNSFKRHDIRHPEKAKSPPDATIFEDKFPIPESTQQAANGQTRGMTPQYENLSRKAAMEYSKANFVLGNDPRDFETDYNFHYRNYNNGRPMTSNDILKNSSIQFDRDAGYGPHTRQMSKRPKFPDKPDMDKPNLSKVNFDVGYEKGPNITTNQAYAINSSHFKRQEPARCPDCAVLADHGPYAGKWGTTYKQDYDGRYGPPNEIDVMELKRSHWDQGHDEPDWSRRTQATTNTRPKIASMDTHASNVVFKGDGTMTFSTTQNDMIGKFDPKDGSRVDDDFSDTRRDHLFLGADPQDYVSEAKAMNKYAGTGSPAQMAEDLHKKKSCSFARGGIYDRFATKDDVSEKKYKRVEQPDRIDGAYYRQTHFDLDATAKNKPRYKTTYFETICRPKIQSINYNYP